MKLSKVREGYYQHSGKASEVARQLAFAGIGLIWVFQINPEAGPRPPDDLIRPGGILAFALLCDLLQYVWLTIVWGSFHRRKERLVSSGDADPDVEAPAWFNRPALVCFGLKLGAVGLAYILIIMYAYKAWTL